MIDIKPLKLIHLLFCFSIVAFAIVTFFLNKNLFVFDFTLSHPDTNTNILSFIAVVFTVLAMNLGTFLFNSLIKKIDSSSSLQEKFAKYQTAFLVKCALLEAAAMFSIVMCLITYNLYFMLVAAFSLIALWLIKPTKEKVYTTLQIQDTDLF
jgi:uncharacterized membrane protein YidH (DUF202 family)